MEYSNFFDVDERKSSSLKKPKIKSEESPEIFNHKNQNLKAKPRPGRGGGGILIFGKGEITKTKFEMKDKKKICRQYTIITSDSEEEEEGRQKFDYLKIDQKNRGRRQRN